MAGRAGLDLRAYFATRSSATAVAGADADALPLQTESQRFLVAGRAIQRTLTDETTVSGDALLLALARHSEVARAELESCGFRLEKLEEVIRGDQPPPLQLDAPLALRAPDRKRGLTPHPGCVCEPGTRGFACR